MVMKMVMMMRKRRRRCKKRASHGPLCGFPASTLRLTVDPFNCILCYILLHSSAFLHFVTVDPLKCILTICYSGSIELTLKCLLTRCYILLHCIIVYYSMLQCVHKYISMDCSVLHCVAVHIGSLQWILVWKKAQAFKLWVWVIFWQPVKSWKEVVLKCEQVRGVVVVRGLP